MTKTVVQLARVSGLSVEILLQAIESAGLPHRKAEDLLDEEESRQLLQFMQRKSDSKIRLGARRDIPTRFSSPHKLNVQIKRKRRVSRETLANAEDTHKKIASDQAIEIPQPVLEPQPSPTTAASEPHSLDSSLAETPKSQKVPEDRPEQAESPPPSDFEKTSENYTVQRTASATDSQADTQSETDQGPIPEKANEQSKKTIDKSESRANHTTEKKFAYKSSKDSVIRKKPTSKAAKKEIVEDDIDEDLKKTEQKSVRKSGAQTHQKIIAIKNQHKFQKPSKPVKRIVMFNGVNIAVTEFAHQVGLKKHTIVRELSKMGVTVQSESLLDFDTATLLAEEFGHTIRRESTPTLQEMTDSLYQQATLQPRSAIVTVMGHVDHGKTTLLDYLRRARVAQGESGGITQHIGAYRVSTAAHDTITFLDTPGHAAFSAMRARGAGVTDIVVLIVAADDGVKPQTLEAIRHAKAAGVSMVVAINKIDKPDADAEKIRQQLAQHEVVAESWGGDVQFVEISAVKGTGVTQLLDAIGLQAELLELQAPVDVPARGVVLEASLAQGRGAETTLLVQRGTLYKGDIIVAGAGYGKVRTLYDDAGCVLKQALPSAPVQILGMNQICEPGELFQVVENEPAARKHAASMDKRLTTSSLMTIRQTTDDAFSQLENPQKSLDLMIRADVQGSLEAILGLITELSNEEVSVQVLDSGVGAITESDVALAKATQALLIGFNVRADARARKALRTSGVEILYYSVIYELAEQVMRHVQGLQTPQVSEQIVGLAEVREVFHSAKFGDIAGCMVVDGAIYRNKRLRVLRESVVIYEGELESLRHFKEDVNQVRKGMECGIGVRNYKEVRAGDQIEIYDTVAKSE